MADLADKIEIMIDLADRPPALAKDSKMSRGGRVTAAHIMTTPNTSAMPTMRLELAEPPSHKRLKLSIQALETRPGYLQTHHSPRVRRCLFDRK
jgi:hypothetical protein